MKQALGGTVLRKDGEYSIKTGGSRYYEQQSQEQEPKRYQNTNQT